MWCKLCGGIECYVEAPPVPCDGETRSAGAAGVVPFERSILRIHHVVMI
jgi:hypothetical protein